MTFNALRFAAAIALLGTAAPGMTATPSQAAETKAAKAITLPFNPPIDVPLRYAFEMQSGNAGRQQIVKSVDELTYSRAENGGYLLRWVTKSIEVQAPGAMQAVLSKVYSIGIDNPLIIAVTPQGYPLALVNEPETRALTDSMLSKLVSSMDAEFSSLPTESRAKLMQMMQAVVDLQRTQSREAFIDSALESPRMMLRNIPPMVPGEPATTEFDAAAPIGAGAIRYLAQSELRRYEPGKLAVVVISSVASPEGVATITKSFTSAMLATLNDPAARKAAEAQIAAMGPVSLSDEVVMIVSLPSGMTESIRYNKRVSIPGQPPRTDSRSYIRMP